VALGNPATPSRPNQYRIRRVQRALLAPEKTDEIFRELDVKVTKKLRDI